MVDVPAELTTGVLTRVDKCMSSARPIRTLTSTFDSRFLTPRSHPDLIVFSRCIRIAVNTHMLQGLETYQRCF
jgi:hypothetical protein